MTQAANRPSSETPRSGGSRSAPTWQSRLTGAPVQGSDGERLGEVAGVYFDNDTDAPAWAAVTTDRFGGYVLLVPLTQAGWDRRLQEWQHQVDVLAYSLCSHGVSGILASGFQP